jgi:hypothetical protein
VNESKERSGERKKQRHKEKDHEEEHQSEGMSPLVALGTGDQRNDRTGQQRRGRFDSIE